MKKILIKISADEEHVPVYGTEGASGADLKAKLEAPVVLAPGDRRLIKTGVVFEIPRGYEGQIRPRSGLALKKGLTVLNSPGTIDYDYRGEVGVILINLGKESQLINNGERIAQIVFAPVSQAMFSREKKENLRETERGTGGFGHTGK